MWIIALPILVITPMVMAPFLLSTYQAWRVPLSSVLRATRNVGPMTPAKALSAAAAVSKLGS